MMLVIKPDKSPIRPQSAKLRVKRSGIGLAHAPAQSQTLIRFDASGQHSFLSETKLLKGNLGKNRKNKKKKKKKSVRWKKNKRRSSAARGTIRIALTPYVHPVLYVLIL